jgi:hypothetical protein
MSTPQWGMLDSDSYTFFQLKEEHEKATIHSSDGNDIIINKYSGKNPIVFCNNCSKKFAFKGDTLAIGGFIVFCREGKGVESCTYYNAHTLCTSKGNYTNGGVGGNLVRYTVYTLNKETNNTYWVRYKKFIQIEKARINDIVTTADLEHKTQINLSKISTTGRATPEDKVLDEVALHNLFTIDEDKNMVDVDYLKRYQTSISELHDWVNSPNIKPEPPFINLTDKAGMKRIMKKFNNLTQPSIDIIKKQINYFKTEIIPSIHREIASKYDEGGELVFSPDLIEQINEFCRVLNEIIDREIHYNTLGAVIKKKPTKKNKPTKKKPSKNKKPTKKKPTKNKKPSKNKKPTKNKKPRKKNKKFLNKKYIRTKRR